LSTNFRSIDFANGKHVAFAVKSVSVQLAQQLIVSWPVAPVQPLLLSQVVKSVKAVYVGAAVGYDLSAFGVCHIETIVFAAEVGGARQFLRIEPSVSFQTPQQLVEIEAQSEVFLQLRLRH